MNNAHSSSTDAKAQGPKTYLVGSADENRQRLNCCPTASSLLCRELSSGLDAIIAIPCKRWGCKHCGQKRAFHLAMRCETASPNRLITLTVNPQLYITPRDAYNGTRRKVADFSKNLRKRLNGFEYFRVLECTKKGWPHYHFLARCRYIPQADLSHLWASMTGAPIVDVRAIHSGVNVFKYVLKYLCKQTYVPWTTRRVAWSRDFFPKTGDKEHRQNPFVNRTRHPKHPADVMAELYRDSQLVEPRPGVWIVQPGRTDNSKQLDTNSF